MRYKIGEVQIPEGKEKWLRFVNKTGEIFIQSPSWLKEEDDGF